MAKIDVEFQYTKEEYVRGHRKQMLASGAIKKRDIIIVPAILLFAIVYHFFIEQTSLGAILLGLSFVVFGMGAMLYLYVPYRTYRLTPKLLETHHLTINDSGIHFKTPTENATFKWNMYKELWESREFYFLVQGKKQFRMLPKRAFSDYQQKEFAKLIEAHAFEFEKVRNI
ncbi:YcxB family protein [Oscillospiraceae bacterium OttesenSCG-928-G22]|nr:YcxB family protein [Oscillospiraceae bacterium OttesenSCG-928-G22]